MFVNIQHPGENGDLVTFQSNWPAGGATDRPRSATLVVTRDDGGEIGV
jgi:secreted PhoX family phosphatase